jgi:cbb3-type cytochrome oxidase subunit 1
MGQRLIKIAVVYLFVGTVFGMYMGITQRFVLVPVHAHLALLGWATLALAGIIYQLYPAASTTRLARIHFWLHNIGLPVFMLALALLLSGYESAGPVVGVGASIVLVGLALFMTNVLLNVKPAAT